MLLEQLLEKGLLQLEDRAHRDEHDQDLPGGETAPDQHMPQPAGPAALVKDLDPEGAEHGADRLHDAVGRLILDQTALHRDDGVAARLIDPADDLPPRIERESGVDLVAVVKGLVHPQDRGHRPKAAEQLLDAALLAPELRGVGEPLQLTAAALPIVRAGSGIRFGHGRHLRGIIFIILS